MSPAPGTVPAHRRCSINGWNEKQTSIVQGQGPAPCGLSRSGLWMIEYHSQTMVCASAQERPRNLLLSLLGHRGSGAGRGGVRQGSKRRAADVRGLLMPRFSAPPTRRAVRRGGRPLRARDEPLSARGQVRLSGQRIQVRRGSRPRRRALGTRQQCGSEAEALGRPQTCLMCPPIPETCQVGSGSRAA